MTTLEMMNAAKATDKTYRIGDLYYCNRHGFIDKDKNPWNADAFKTINEIMDINTWKVEDIPMILEEAMKEIIRLGERVKVLEDNFYSTKLKEVR